MTEQRGPDAKKVYSFRFFPNDMLHWRMAAESNGLTLTEWFERCNNSGLYDFVLAYLDAGTHPGRRSKLIGMQAALLIDSRRKEDNANGGEQRAEDHPQERSRGDGDVSVDRRSTGKKRGRRQRQDQPAQADVGEFPSYGAAGSDAPIGLPETGDVERKEVITREALERGFAETREQSSTDALEWKETANERSTRLALNQPASENEHYRVEEDGNIVKKGVGDAPVILATAPGPELAKQVLAKRGYCEHGTARGYNCWRCGGKAKITGDPEALSKRDQAKAAREQAKAAKKKKGKR